MRDEFGSPARMSRGDSPAQRDVAFVFQQYSLYPHLSVFDNLAFPLRSPARPTPEPTIRQKVNEVAALLRISDKLDQRVTKLSGGQMQRVAIGRALVRSPSVYLMDEPLSSLDAKLRAELRLELKRIQVELGATILYVTHDQIEAMTMASRIGVIRDGRLLQVGTPREIYESPNELYVATRLGAPAINLVPAELLPETSMPTRTATVGVRTEHLLISEGEWQPGRAGAVGRASRRPKPRAHRLQGPQPRHTGGPASTARRRPGSRPRVHRSALLRCVRTAHRCWRRMRVG